MSHVNLELSVVFISFHVRNVQQEHTVIHQELINVSVVLLDIILIWKVQLDARLVQQEHFLMEVLLVFVYLAMKVHILVKRLKNVNFVQLEHIVMVQNLENANPVRQGHLKIYLDLENAFHVVLTPIHQVTNQLTVQFALNFLLLVFLVLEMLVIVNAC